MEIIQYQIEKVLVWEEERWEKRFFQPPQKVWKLQYLEMTWRKREDKEGEGQGQGEGGTPQKGLKSQIRESFVTKEMLSRI